MEQVSRKDILVNNIDKYLRDPDTAFAHLIEAVSPYKGNEYLHSKCKRILDLSVAVPAAVVATPFITVFGIAKKIEDGGSVFFVQERLTPEMEGFKMIKIRSMVDGADRGRESLKFANGKRPENDSRNTRLGAFMRKYKIDELPQLFQVIRGQMSLLGVRPMPQYVLDDLEERWNSTTFDEYIDAYRQSKLGLSGLNQSVGSRLNDDAKRFHTDVFYSKNANLGLDMYLLWRTFARVAHLI